MKITKKKDELKKEEKCRLFAKISGFEDYIINPKI